jgi:hypothetical protein
MGFRLEKSGDSAILRPAMLRRVDATMGHLNETAERERKNVGAAQPKRTVDLSALQQ